MALKKGKLISIMSTKGGVGKTILTMMLAYLLHKQNKSVLILDLDLYGGAIALNLKLSCNKSIYNAVDDLTNNRYKDINDYIYSYNENIDVIAACKDPRQASKINSNNLELLINSALYKYDYVLVDNSNSLDRISITSLDMASKIVFVITNDLMDLKNAKSFISILKDTNFEDYKVLLNNSINTNKKYFSLFDIKHILKTNIDYTLSKNAYIKNLDGYLLDGSLDSIMKYLERHSKSDYKHLDLLARELGE